MIMMYWGGSGFDMLDASGRTGNTGLYCLHSEEGLRKVIGGRQAAFTKHQVNSQTQNHNSRPISVQRHKTSLCVVFLLPLRIHEGIVHASKGLRVQH